MASEASGINKSAVTADVQPVDNTETEIDLIELLGRLWDKSIYIIIAALIGGILLGVYSFFIAVPQYKSASQIYVVSSKDSVVNLADLQIGSYLTSDYQEVFKAWEVHQQVIDSLKLDYTYGELQGMLTISNPANTRILSIEVQSDDPAESALLANEYANVARDYIAEKMAMDRPNVLSIALEPVAPFSPNITRNIIIGVVLGAMIACVVVTLQFVLDDRVRSSEDIEKYAGMPTLAVVPLSSAKNVLKMQGKNGNREYNREYKR